MKPKNESNDVDDTINYLRSGAHETVDKLADASAQAVDALSQKGLQIKDTEQQFEDNCRSYIHKNPFTALGFAVGAGFLLSRILSGR